MPQPLFDTLSRSPKHLPFRHIPSAETLPAGTTEAVQTCFQIAAHRKCFASFSRLSLQDGQPGKQFLP